MDFISRKKILRVILNGIEAKSNFKLEFKYDTVHFSFIVNHEEINGVIYEIISAYDIINKTYRGSEIMISLDNFVSFQLKLNVIYLIHKATNVYKHKSFMDPIFQLNQATKMTKDAAVSIELTNDKSFKDFIMNKNNNQVCPGCEGEGTIDEGHGPQECCCCGGTGK